MPRYYTSIQQVCVQGDMSTGSHIPTKAGCYVARTELLSIFLSCYLVFTSVYLLTVREDVTVEFDHTQSQTLCWTLLDKGWVRMSVSCERCVTCRGPPLHVAQRSQETDISFSSGIQTRSPSMQSAADPHLGPRGHWDRHKGKVIDIKSKIFPANELSVVTLQAVLKRQFCFSKIRFKNSNSA